MNCSAPESRPLSTFFDSFSKMPKREDPTEIDAYAESADSDDDHADLAPEDYVPVPRPDGTYDYVHPDDVDDVSEHAEERLAALRGKSPETHDGGFYPDGGENSNPAECRPVAVTSTPSAPIENAPAPASPAPEENDRSVPSNANAPAGYTAPFNSYRPEELCMPVSGAPYWSTQPPVLQMPGMSPQEASEAVFPAPIEFEDGGYVFFMGGDGLYGRRAGGKHMSRLTGPFIVLADIVDESGVSFGKVVQPQVKNARPVLLDRQSLFSSPKKCLGLLVAQGLWASGSPLTLAIFQTFVAGCQGATQVLGSTRTGWHDTLEGKIFVLPNQGMPSSPAQAIHLAEREPHKAMLNYTSGTLNDWQREVGSLCVGNPVLVFAICSALSSIFLKDLNLDGACVHFFGSSSLGKSTALQVGMSACLGRPDALFQRWNTTANGLESLLLSYNDRALALDELKEISPQDFDRAVYMISNGKPKRRYNDSHPEHERWRLICLSSGEISGKFHLEGSQIRQMEGQAVRFIDIPAEVENGLGIFHTCPAGYTPEGLSRHLQQAVQYFHGTPMAVFIEQLAKASGEGVSELWQAMEFFRQQYPAPEVRTVQRVHTYFALSAAVGILGTRWSILPWSEQEAVHAAAYAYNTWQNYYQEHSQPEPQRILARLHTIMERYGEGRFHKYPASGDIGSLGDAYGYRQDLGAYIELVLPADGFERLFQGHEPRAVRLALKEAGLLLCDGRNHTTKRRIPGNPNARCTVIRVPKS